MKVDSNLLDRRLNMTESTRRQFLQVAGVGTAVAIASPFTGCAEKKTTTSSEGWERLNLGLASYTVRKFELTEALDMCKRVGLERIALKSMHMPLESTPDQIHTIAGQVRSAGLELYGAGVVYMKSEDEVKRAFAYAKEANLKVIIGVPNHDLLQLCNELVKEYDIKVGIHNHGPGDKVYPTPQSAYELIKDLDPRMGLCIDIGHTQRSGVDPSIAAEQFADRLHDVHIKDVHQATKEGKTVEIGRGVIDIPKFLRTLLKIGYSGVVALEYEKDPTDPLPGMAESVGYLKGVLDVI